MEDTHVHFLRLVTGEEILAVIESFDDRQYTVSNPMIPVERQDDEGRVTMLAQYAPFTRSSVMSIAREHVITCLKLHPEMERHYFLSVQINKRVEDISLGSLRETNAQMEEVLATGAKPRRKRVSPGNDKLH